LLPDAALKKVNAANRWNWHHDITIRIDYCLAGGLRRPTGCRSTFSRRRGQAMSPSNNTNFMQEYWIDAWQRSILTLDVLRQRGNQYFEQLEKTAPNVLSFDFEPIRDGRTLPRPVGYALVRIVPPAGTIIDPIKPPFVVVDPRAGHGPGIGGMKHDSEIGVALAAGHACYFIGFFPEPMPGQTIEDVFTAQAAFLEEVAARHPEAEGKPVVIGNCQAGWQTMIVAALRPELFGAILLAGSPLSYWAGVRGINPMRYLGGTLGGTWLTALAGDLGNGKFDGANLVGNFESLNPANTYWEKPYNLYSNVDAESGRFLEFEKWWGNPVLLNAQEMQWIADNLFVGNKLASGEIHTSDGTRVDLRNIRVPIIVLCSWGDNITPPQQALGWITDLYESDDEIAANGQTIVYTLHQSIGHLGIFVSGKVATKEHAEFASCMDMINLMPPGLYEAVITDVNETTANPHLIHGKYLFSLERRTLDDIRALGTNSEEDNQRFAAAARLSEVNQGLYRTLLQPAVRAMASEQSADLLRQSHPSRLRFGLISDRNPFMKPLKGIADTVRADRKPVADNNPLLTMERVASTWMSTWWESYRLVRDAMTEATFLATYGSPILQASLGLGTPAATGQRRIARDLGREAVATQRRIDLEQMFEVGGVPEAIVRSLIYIRLADRSVDERGFAMLQAIRRAQPANRRLTLEDVKALFRDQYQLIGLDEERAVRAISRLLPEHEATRQAGLDAIREIVAARGAPGEEAASRLRRIEALFNELPSSFPATGATHA
jgi:pimeloyl-ACP methyl ester carboxylesterase